MRSSHRHLSRLTFTLLQWLPLSLAGLTVDAPSGKTILESSASAVWGTPNSTQGSWIYSEVVGWIYDDGEPGGWVFLPDHGWLHAEVATLSDGSASWWLYAPETGWHWSSTSAFPWCWEAEGDQWVNVDWASILAPSFYETISDPTLFQGRSYSSAFTSRWGGFGVSFAHDGTFLLQDADIIIRGVATPEAWILAMYSEVNLDPGRYNRFSDRLFFWGLKMMRRAVP